MAELRSLASIASDAMAYLGRDPIADLEDPKRREARLARERLQGTTDALLRSYNWNFATYFADLAGETLARAHFSTSRRFALPAGGDLPYCLRVRKVDTTQDWSVVNRYIYTSANAPLTISYVGRPTDPGAYDPLFADMLAVDLALKLINLLAPDEVRKRTQELRTARKDIRRAAVLADAIEGSAEELPEDSSGWLAARRPM